MGDNARFGLGATPPVAGMYANACGRFRVADKRCNLSFAGTAASGSPAPLATAAALVKARSFALGNGVADAVPLAGNAMGFSGSAVNVPEQGDRLGGGAGGLRLAACGLRLAALQAALFRNLNDGCHSMGGGRARK